MIPRRTRSAGPSGARAAAAQDLGAPRTVFTLSEEETFDLGHNVGQRLRGGELIVLEGELGTGKTVFARGVASGLGVPPEDVTSPSFTLVQEYACGRLPVYHVDLYRLEEGSELDSLGLDELLTSGGVVLVEWGERLPPRYRREALAVRIHDLGEGSRRIEIVPRLDAPRPRRGDA